MVEAEILSGLHEHIRAHFHAKLSIDRVGRNFGRTCECDLAIATAIEVGDVAVANLHGARCLEYARFGGDVVLERTGKGNDLEGRSGWIKRLSGAIVER